jgi:Phasin protein
MVAASRVQANGKSPVHNIFQMYFGGLEAFGQSYDPFMKGLARSQLEFMGLLNRRTQAVMEIPSRLSQCRTPQDVFNEQARFWQTAYQEYSESTARMTQAFAAFAMPGFGLASAGQAGNGHDYLTFPEPQEPEHRSRERRAA